MSPVAPATAGRTHNLDPHRAFAPPNAGRGACPIYAAAAHFQRCSYVAEPTMRVVA